VNNEGQVFELLQQGEGTLLPICFIFSGLDLEYFFNCVLSLSFLFSVNRHFGETNMNVRSSRSHAIFRMVQNSESYYDSVFATLFYDHSTYSNEKWRQLQTFIFLLV
jgi:hypothetical protein